jgi:hypothetical protein
LKNEEIKNLTELNIYDLNYRLKKKFLRFHDDYWALVQFFKIYEKNFQKKSTKQTDETLLKAKSQIPSLETIYSSKCYYCRRVEKKMLEINICLECKSILGIKE